MWGKKVKACKKSHFSLFRHNYDQTFITLSPCNCHSKLSLTLLGDLLPLHPVTGTNIYCNIFLLQKYNSSLQRKLIFHNILPQFDSKESMMRPFKEQCWVTVKYPSAKMKIITVSVKNGC